MISPVPFTSLDLAELAPIIGAERQATLLETAAASRSALDGRAVVHVNSTATGGGVAEMLPTLLGYTAGAGIDARWYVLSGTPPFFALTKRLHNRLHGHQGDAGSLAEQEHSIYEEVAEQGTPGLLEALKPGDIVVLHDPQTLGLAPALRGNGIHVIWRCHIGVDEANDATAEAWGFLSRYFHAVNHFVFSRPQYRPSIIDENLVTVIRPSLDPLSAKNISMTGPDQTAILRYTGLLGEPVGDPPSFVRRDGSNASVERRAQMIQLMAPPEDEPLVVQVSRWDKLKDMAGVMTAFADYVAPTGNGHLVLAGPDVSSVTDDPEGAEELAHCQHIWNELPMEKRRRIHLACLPTDDVEENALMVNALQRHAAVVCQKSLAEGFGLTVVEAMWKGRPVVASAVGGIRDQIDDGLSGSLIQDPTDLAAFGTVVRKVLDDPDRAGQIGAAAEYRASTDFLPDRHLRQWAEVIGGAIS